MQNEIKDDEQQKKKRRYIQLLSLLYMQISEFNEMKNKSIKENFKENCLYKDNTKDKDNVKDKDITTKGSDNDKNKDDAEDKPKYEYLKCYLVNKDMIDNYKELYLYQTISKLIEFLKGKKKNSINFDYFKNNENVLENCFKNLGIDYSKLEPLVKKLIPTFFETEKLKLQGYYYPYNFFILREEIFEYLFEKEIKNQKINIESFKLYKMLIGKEGVFIWDLNKENKQNKYISIYYLNDCISEINKVYLFKEEEDFLKELYNNILDKKDIKEYYLFRNIKNNEIGLFNLIDDGKIMGKYINLFRSQLFESKTESGELKKSLTILVKKDEQKIKKINDFLKYLLINLTYIKDLNEYSIYFTKNKDSLLGAYSSFAYSYKENINSNLDKQIDTFIDLFSEKSLGDSVKFNEENKNQAFEKLIENVIDSFNTESKPKKNKTDNTVNNDQNKIFDLFYGEKLEQAKKKIIKQNNKKKEEIEEIVDIKKVFNTLYINPNDFTYDGKTSIDLNMIMDINYLKCKGTYIQKLPNILIIVLENNNLIEVPFKLNVHYGYYNKEYKLLSTIRKYDNMDNYFSIVIIGNDFHKIFFNSSKNSYENEIIYDKNEINKSIIFFYETTMKEENYSSGNNEIFMGIFSSAGVQQNKNTSNNFIINNGGYQDINNTNLIYNQFYNNNNVINNNNNVMINNYFNNNINNNN